MAKPIVADPDTDSRPNPTTRAERALRLFAERGSLIRAVASDTFEVPSCGMRGKRYIVRYGGSVESCSCKDFQFGHTCKHLLAVGIMHAARRSGVREVRTVRVAAGDPFKAVSKKRAATIATALAAEECVECGVSVAGPDEGVVALNGDVLCHGCTLPTY